VLSFSLELPRSVAEGALFASSHAILRRLSSGDGHPVLVLPGFMADDRSTAALRFHLRRLGYVTHGWRLGRNIGPTKAALDGMTNLVDDLVDRNGRKVSIVGWSLGGVYARELARRQPALVRTVITLGSPFRLTDARQTRTARMYGRYQPWHLPDYQPPTYVPPDGPLAMPSTAVYTRTDGIVAWRACVQDVGPQRENIEVFGSHCGLGHNPAVVYAVTDRLARAEGDWAPFKPPTPLRRLFPRPVEA
jgi:pimeloyl-ACP methyl ester carboxylesterase